MPQQEGLTLIDAQPDVLGLDADELSDQRRHALDQRAVLFGRPTSSRSRVTKGAWTDSAIGTPSDCATIRQEARAPASVCGRSATP